MNTRALLLIMVIPLALTAAAPLTVDEATRLAWRHSKGAQLTRLKADAARLEADAARQQRYPRLTAFGLGAYAFRPVDLTLREGSLTPTLDALGVDLGLGPLSPTVGPFPARDLTLLRGEHFLRFGGLTILQPLTQQWRIASGMRAADSARLAADRETARTLAEIQVSVEELFAGILLEDQRQAQHAARLAFEVRRLRDAENARATGEALDDAVLGSQARRVQAEAELLRSRQQRERLGLQLAELIGRPDTIDLTLDPVLPERPAQALDYWLAKAAQNPDARIAAAVVERARAGVSAARQARIPEVSAFATGFVQGGLPLAPSTGGTVGIALTWDVFDFGRRDSEIARGLNRQRSAELDRERREEEAVRLIRVTFQDFTHAGELVVLAEQARAYRRRALELAEQSVKAGLALPAVALEAEMNWREAEADLTAARLQRHVAGLRLHFLTGELASGPVNNR
ncbi:MAG TPA: TolC family protein [Opitutus sp.]|nr:TolC family protein [Opitutus sp.]